MSTLPKRYQATYTNTREIRVLKGPQGELLNVQKVKGGWAFIDHVETQHKRTSKKTQLKRKAQRNARKINRG